MRHHRKKALKVGVGDTVEIFFDHRRYDGHEPFEARITKVIYRTIDNPIITFIGTEGNEGNCDSAYVTKIVAKVPYVVKSGPKENIFRSKRMYPPKRLGLGGGIIEGHSLEDLASYYLSGVSSDIELKCPIHRTRLRLLYLNAGCPGEVDHWRKPLYWGMFSATIRVREKTFKKWVLANAQRICESKREHTALLRVRAKKIEDDLWDAYMADEAEMEARALEEEGILVSGPGGEPLDGVQEHYYDYWTD